MTTFNPIIEFCLLGDNDAQAEEEVKRLKEKLKRLAKEEDNLRYYHLCASCLTKVDRVNGPPVQRTQPYFAV